MTREEKNKIDELKTNGFSYSQISKVLNVPLSTIKSYFRRQNKEEKSSILTCKNCGKELVNIDGKKKKTFCCAKCRIEWWNKNKKLMNTQNCYEHVCACCHKHFMTYGKKDQKYCSRDCYLKGRYGSYE